MGAWKILYILLFIGSTFASPYYYRESKHHSEHHREYSSAQHDGVGQVSESLPDHDVSVDSPLITPERYTSFTAPSQSSSEYSQSYGGGYPFSHGSMQHGGSHLSSLPVTSVTSQRLVQQTSSPVVVRQKIVKVYTYPSTSSQSGYIFSSSGSGYHGSGSLSGYPTRAEKLVVVPRVESLGTYGSGHSFNQKHYSQVEAGQKEVGMEYGQEPFEHDLDIGQREVSLHQPPKFQTFHSSQEMESEYRKHGTGDLEVGQSAVSEYEQEPLGDGLEISQSHYSKHMSGNLEFGQRDGQQEVNIQKPGQLKFVNSDQKSERHYDIGDFETGQRETGLDKLELGQKESPIINYNYKQSKHDSTSGLLEFGQKEESLFEKPVKDEFIAEGQHEETLFGNSRERGDLKVGQKEETLYPHSGDLEVGQTEILEHHEKQEGHYVSNGGVSSELGQTQLYVGGQEPLDLGQREEPLMNGQKEQSLYLSKNSGLEVGQVPSHELLTSSSHRREFSHYKRNKEGKLELGQREDTLNRQELEAIGQKKDEFTESLYNDKVSSLEVGQKEVPSHRHLITSHQQVAGIFGKYGSGDLQVGQTEEPIKGTESGQKEESMSLYNINYGKTESKRQKVLPALEHAFTSSYSKESSLHQKHESGNLEVSQKEEPISREDSGQKEETVSLYSINYGKTVPNDQKPIDLGQHNVRENFHQQTKLVIGQTPYIQTPIKTISQRVKEEDVLSGQRVKEEDVLSGQREEGIPFAKDHHHIAHGHHHKELLHGGYSWHSVPCDHGKHYQHGEFGFGQEGHNKQTWNEREKFKDYSAKIVTSGTDKVQASGIVDLDKKVEDLAALLDLEGTAIKGQNPSSIKENVKVTITPPTTTPTVIHNAQIQELGSENLDVRSSFQSAGFPQARVNVQEIHKEEIKYEPSTLGKTYSKKHSRHYSRRQESQSSDPLVISQYQTGQQSSGKYSGYSQQRFSSSEIGSHYLSDQPVQRQHISQQNSQSDRHAAIDSFLSELDKEIDRETRRPGGGFVQVSQQHAPSQSGVTPFSDKSLYSHTSETTSSSGSSWLKKVGENIGSAYNKAKDKISQSFSSAQGKAKEMVKNVKDQVGYS